MAPDVLILAAFHPELAPLRKTLGDALTGIVGGRSVAARTTGVGLPAAAAGAATHLVELMPRAVVLIGTCGAYSNSGFQIGDVIAARQLHLVDPASFAGHTEFPEPVALVVEANVPMAEALVMAGARPCRLATTLAITVDDAAAARIAEHAGASVEHLEAHGVAVACAARGVPFATALGVANFVGGRGRAEWRLHHGVAESAAAEVVLRALELGAESLAP